MANYWLFEKHKKDIEITGITYKDLRFKIDSETKFKLRKLEDNLFNTQYDWDQIKPSYNFFYEFDTNENTIKRWLHESELNSSSFVYVETLSDEPIIRTRTEYLIANWLDFIDANVGQGFICITDDFKLLMEFTDDFKYHLFSNFMICPDSSSNDSGELALP